MNVSLRAKLFLLVGFAISLAALPIIFFSRSYLLENGIERERHSFVNTVLLVEDSLSVRYLHLLTSEVESVLNAKSDLRQTASILREIAVAGGEAGSADAMRRWQKILGEKDFHLAMYDAAGMPLISDGLISAAIADGQKDFKGQPVQSMIIPRPGQNDCQFAVVRVQQGKRMESPVLLCFMPVRSQGMIVLAVPVADTRESRLMLENRMMQGIQERLEGLELSRGASISIISTDGRCLAAKGEQLSLDEVDESVLRRVREGETLEGEAVGKAGRPFMYRLDYFKALDWYVVAAVPMSAITEPAEELSRHLFSVAAGLLVLSLLVMLVLTVRIIAPLRLLTDKARKLAAEDFSAEHGMDFAENLVEGLPSRQKDEVGQLAASFAAMVEALVDNIRKLKENIAVRQRMQGELSAARDIQMGILPAPDSAPRLDSYSAAAFLEPAKEVGGDLYDFFTAPDGRQVIVIGDVSDKGVSAALFMSMTVTLVRYAIADGLDCAEAMRRINERLAENNPSCMFVTLFIGLFDPATGRLDYASGAHCPPFVVNPEASVPVRALMDTSGPLVGAMEGMEYELCHAVIAPGEYCLIYTDGVSEAMNESKELFTEDRIAEVLDGLREAEPEQVIEGVMEAVKKHRGEAAQSDDITMLCFKRI